MADGWNIIRTAPADTSVPDGSGWAGYVEFLPPGVASGSGPFRVDQAGNLTVNGQVTLASTFNLNYGTNSAGSAHVLTALGATSGSATQLSDLFRDYMVYLQVSTSGTATSLTIGHTSGASDVTLISNIAVTAGDLWTFRLPAGWYFKWTGTSTAVGNQNAVSC